MTDGMDGKQRAEMDETLDGFDKRKARQKRAEYARAIPGGEVVTVGKR